MVIQSRQPSLIVILGLLSFPTAVLAQGILYVDANATGTNDGSSWCDAYVYLQDALATARASEGTVAEIRVAQGKYKPDRGANETPGDRTSSFELVNGVALLGGYAGCGAPDSDDRNLLAFESVLSGDLAADDGPNFASNGENAYHVIVTPDASAQVRLEPDTILDGFHIVAGNANSGFGGGGIRVYETHNPTIKHCKFHGNSGGGLAFGPYLRLTIDGCDIRDNRGSGITVGANSRLTIKRTLIRGNTAISGAGVSMGEPIMRIEDSIIAFNIALGDGGGIYWYDNRNTVPIIQNSIIFGNTAQLGDGIYGDNFAYPDFSQIESSILWSNAAMDGSQIYLGSRPGTDCGNRDHLKLNHCDVEGGASNVLQEGLCYLLEWEPNCIDEDPMFFDPDGADNIPATDDDDFRFCPGSPATGMGPSWLSDVECCMDADCDDLDPCNGANSCDASGSCVWTISADCNANTVEDSCDIFSGTSADCNTNAVPDECELIGNDCNANGVPDECEPLKVCDSDKDGVSDSEDECPNTKDSETVVTSGCNTNVDNHLFQDGCSMLDLIEECGATAENHRGYVRCVGWLTRGWRVEGLLSSRERLRVIRCVAGSIEHSGLKTTRVGPWGKEGRKH